MAEKTQNQEALHIQKPQPGQSSVLAVDPGTTIYLDFPLDQAEVVFQDGDLIFRFQNGEQVELDNFEEVLSSTNLLLADGTEVSGDQIMETLQPGADEPAAGAAPPSGGAGEYNDYLGDSPDGIDRLGTLGPREFGFTLEEPRAEGEDELPPEPPPVPPQAFDDFGEFLVDTARDERGESIYRVYDIDTQGNVLDNDVPIGVNVIGFTVEGTAYGSESLGTQVTLPSGAQFTLSSDGTYRYVVDNVDTFSDSPTDINFTTPSAQFNDIDSGYEVARLNFDPASLGFDRVEIEYTDYAGDTVSQFVSGSQLLRSGGIFDIYDEDGIKDVEINYQRGDGVALNSLEIIDADVNLDQETIHYTIEGADGLTSSANLIISFGDAPPPEPIPMPEYDYNTTAGPV